MIFVTNHEILEKAKEAFPQFFLHGYTWYPLGRNGVRMRFDTGKTLFFTYMGENEWSIETPKHYAARLKGEQKKQKGD